MAEITTRQDFKNYCLRRLGWPVIEINVDDDQVEDRITDALQYFTDRHADGTQLVYYIKALEQSDIDNKYLDMNPNITTDADGYPMDIVGVTRIFPVSDSSSPSVNMFDLRYQLRLNELYDFTSASYINYTLTAQHLRSLEIMFTGEVPIRFNRHMKRLFIDWSWGNDEAPVGQIVVAECYASLNPDVYNWVYNDRWLKEYATALIKRTWGANMSKFDNILLPGNVKMRGSEIYDDATKEIERLETEMESFFGAPLQFFMN